ncbi:MAG: hypothetical protein K2Q45_09800 [Nitrosomonas sp.]|nr:hypothetical protein [Nitrosomonas sp.]
MSQKLVNLLTKQFSREELREIVTTFFDELTSSHPDLDFGKSPQQLAEYLVTKQPEGEARLITTGTFLKAAGAIDERTSDLLGYLLHTLIKNENKQGLISLSVNRRQTVELINAARNATPLIPDYSEKHLEHKNGARNSQFEDISDFVPECGLLEPLGICQAMAAQLLTEIGDPDFINPEKKPDNPLEILNGRLIFNIIDPAKSPLLAILIHKNKFPEHPLYDEQVRERFITSTSGRLPIYVYGVDSSTPPDQYLHVHEDGIRGLLLCIAVENYHQLNLGKYAAAIGDDMKSKNKAGDFGNNNSYGDNTTIYNIVSSPLQGVQIQRDAIGLGPQSISQLLKQLQEVARQDSAINSQRLTELFGAIQTIQAELQKNKNADRGILAKAKTVLETFKDIVSIAGSIQAIIALLP